MRGGHGGGFHGRPMRPVFRGRPLYRGPHIWRLRWGRYGCLGSLFGLLGLLFLGGMMFLLLLGLLAR